MKLDAYDAARALAGLLEQQANIRSAVVTSYGQDYSSAIVAVERVSGESYVLEVRGVER